MVSKVSSQKKKEDSKTERQRSRQSSYNKMSRGSIAGRKILKRLKSRQFPDSDDSKNEAVEDDNLF